MGKKAVVSDAAKILGQRSYKARLERFGIERLQEIARENGKLGGRPKATTKVTKSKATKKGPKK